MPDVLEVPLPDVLLPLVPDMPDEERELEPEPISALVRTYWLLLDDPVDEALEPVIDPLVPLVPLVALPEPVVPLVEPVPEP